MKKRLKNLSFKGVLEIPLGFNSPPRMHGASHTSDFLMNLGNLAAALFTLFDGIFLVFVEISSSPLPAVRRARLGSLSRLDL